MQHYAVVFFPKIDIKELQTFRKKYDPLWNILNPHITLMFPFDNFGKEEIINHLQYVASKTKVFQININDFMKSFDDYFFLIVTEGKEKIYELHDELYTKAFLPYLRTDIPFIPHMTIGLFRTKDNQFQEALYNEALAEAKKMNFDFTCMFSEMSLIQGDGLTPAKVIKIFEFK